MTEPRTKAGKALLRRFAGDPVSEKPQVLGAILAIEAEAEQQGRDGAMRDAGDAAMDRLRRAVARLAATTLDPGEAEPVPVILPHHPGNTYIDANGTTVQVCMGEGCYPDGTWQACPHNPRATTLDPGEARCWCGSKRSNRVHAESWGHPFSTTIPFVEERARELAELATTLDPGEAE